MATRKRQWKPKDSKSKKKGKGKDKGIRIGSPPMNPGFSGEDWKGFHKKKNGPRRPRIAADFGNAPIGKIGMPKAFSI